MPFEKFKIKTISPPEFSLFNSFLNPGIHQESGFTTLSLNIQELFEKTNPYWQQASKELSNPYFPKSDLLKNELVLPKPLELHLHQASVFKQVSPLKFSFEFKTFN